jgi:putative oxidoreductase
MEFTWLQRLQPQLLAMLRIATALLFLQHPLVKLFGFPPGVPPGPVAVGSLFWIAGIVEIIAAPVILIGLFTRLAAFLVAGEMAIAYWIVHAKMGFYPIANKGEAAVLFCFVFLYLAAAGPGAWSVDGARFRARISR